MRQHILVTGRVQGVGYRKFVVSHALRLNLSGYCKNLPSGDVEIAVEGHSDKIQELIRELHIGPPRAEVDKVIVTSPLALLYETSFVIRD